MQSMIDKYSYGLQMSPEVTHRCGAEHEIIISDQKQVGGQFHH